MRNNIHIPTYEEEYEELVKYRNHLQHFHKFPMENFDTLYKYAKESLKDRVGFTDCIASQIEYLKETNRCHIEYERFQNWISQNLNNRNIHKTMKAEIGNSLGTVATRMAVCRLLIDKYEPIDQKTVRDNEAVNTAARTWRAHVETNIGWRNEISFTAGIPGDYTREIEEDTDWMNRKIYNFKANLFVDESYLDIIKANGIEVVDIGTNKLCLTLAAEEIEEHDLVDDDVKLFKAKVAYTKVPRDVNTWSLQKDDWDKILYIEDKHIAVQPVTGSDPIIATGKDATWAIRTMRRRMKKKMLNLMDCI